MARANLKLTKVSFIPNPDDTHTLYRLVDDIFTQLQETLVSGVNGPTAVRTLLTDPANYFDRAPRVAVLATLQKFGVPSRTPFSSYMHSFRVAVASAVNKDGPLAPSPKMAMELIRIRTAQYLIVPKVDADLVTGYLYDLLATLWTTFAHLKHNISPTIDGGAFAPAFQGSCSHASSMVTSSASPAALHRNTRRNGRPDATHGDVNVSHTLPQRYVFGLLRALVLR